MSAAPPAPGAANIHPHAPDARANARLQRANSSKPAAGRSMGRRAVEAKLSDAALAVPPRPALGAGALAITPEPQVRHATARRALRSSATGSPTRLRRTNQRSGTQHLSRPQSSSNASFQKGTAHECIASKNRGRDGPAVASVAAEMGTRQSLATLEDIATSAITATTTPNCINT